MDSNEFVPIWRMRCEIVLLESGINEEKFDNSRVTPKIMIIVELSISLEYPATARTKGRSSSLVDCLTVSLLVSRKMVNRLRECEC